MADPFSSYSIFPLGDSAITIDVGNCIDEQHNIKALAVHDWLQAHRFPGVLDIIMAYSSVSVFYDPAVVAASGVNGPIGVFNWLEGLLERAWKEAGAAAGCGEGGDEESPAGAGGGADGTGDDARLIRIPVCYEGEYAPDLGWVAAQKGLSPEAVVDLHA
ncbi:MAG TPA: carboxyltransferase domain-containing protein, partial [Puia sp.]|nr:carboxyltransferase domain-containing protein [Puia sp.]